MPQTKAVSIGIFVGAGSRYEQDSEAGSSHLLEHMLFKGTRNRPGPALISGPIETVGGVMNALTDRELTLYWCKVPSEHFELALDVLSDMVVDSTILTEELDRERKVVVEELAMTNDQPDARVELLIDEILWPDQPMGRDVGGSKESVMSMSRRGLIDYYRQQYVASNSVVSIVGNVAHRDVVSAVERRLGEWESGQVRNWVGVSEGASSHKIALEYRKSDQANICLAFPGVSATDPRRNSLDMLNVVLGDGMTSRLFMEMRERRGLAYDVHSSSVHYRDCGSVTVHSSVDPTNAELALSVIISELQNLRDGIEPQELIRAIEFTAGRLLLRMEDSQAVMFSLGTQEMLSDRIRTPDEVVEAIRTVTLEDLRECADKFLRSEEYKIAIVGPFRSGKRFQKLLN